MASPCSLHFREPDSPALRKAAEAAIAEVRRIEHKFSRYRSDSVISKINAAAGVTSVPIDSETADLLAFAHQLWTISDGLFDITSGVLRKGWDFRVGRTPTEEQLQALLPLVGWHHLSFDRSEAFLSQRGMEIDFGGFGKEYAVDRAAAELSVHGVSEAMVNLGGDIHALNTSAQGPQSGRKWRLEIQHPRPPASLPGAAIAHLDLAAGGLATSGDYERYFIKDGVRYCHVLNPKSGWPVSAYQSVSVIAANATAAGALTTIAMLKGNGAETWLHEQGASYLLVDANGCLLSNATPDSARPGTHSTRETRFDITTTSQLTRSAFSAVQKEHHT